MQLLLGCGHARRKVLFEAHKQDWTGLVTLDINPEVGADVVHDLCDLPLPFETDSADEIHAYDVLEHTRGQGDWRGFFAEFAEFYRILRPGGLLFLTAPRWDGVWAWGDPGHRRVISAELLSYLSQRVYAQQLDGAEKTNRTDYRAWWRGDFEVEAHIRMDGPSDGFVLRAIKPSRWRCL